MKNTFIKFLSLILCVVIVNSFLCSCGIISCNFSSCRIPTFREMCVTTEDGFTYYYDSNVDGVFIIDIPSTEELIIPEYINEKKVLELGHEDVGMAYRDNYNISGPNTKVLTVQHPFYTYGGTIDFPNLTKLIFKDFTYCISDISFIRSVPEEILVPYYVGSATYNIPEVELKKSDRTFNAKEFKPKTILIPTYVTVIDKGVFDGLEGVKIKTAYENKPDSWEDGWNGACEVEWGAEISYLHFEDRCNTTEDGFTYYYNKMNNDGPYIIELPDDSTITIPEYIEGKKVLQLGYNKGDIERGIYGHYTKNLIVKHEFNCAEGNYRNVLFDNLTSLKFIDFLYCNASTPDEEITVPYYIGKKSRSVPEVKLKKSDRVFSLENFKPKVINIPEYVKVIDKGVFDGLEGVKIRTSYESKPDGWEDGWNGNCEVEWGVNIRY